MRQPKLQFSANDNAPLRQTRIRKSFRQSNPAPVRKAVNPITAYKRKAAAAWIVPIIAMLCGAYAVWQSVLIDVLFWPSLIIGALLLLTAVHSKPDSRLRNISGLLMVAAFATGLTALLAQNGFTLIAVELTLLVTALALFGGWVFWSKPLVLLSAFSGILYLASHYPELGLMTGLTDQVSQLGAGLMPWLILGQIVLAQKVRSSAVLLAAILAGYAWLGTIATDIPLSALAGLGFAIAAAQYWLGNALEETETIGADIHKLCAWIVGLGAALYVQSLWLNADIGQAKPFWPPSTLWWAVLGITMFTLFIVSLMRFKTSHLSLSGIFIICLAVLTLPLATAKPDLVFAVFDSIPGLNARPGFGLVIGAAIIAGGFIWVVGGLKRGSLLGMTTGAITVGIQAMVLFQPERFNADLGVVFVVSLICALCIGGLVAGASPDRKHPLGNYA